jgi:N4-gp56 family major capsid protein
MATTAFTTDNALTKKAWEEQLFRDTVKESYFSKFMGEGKSKLVQTKTRLEKEKGDNITFGIRMRLTGAGVEDNETLEGKEEDLATYDYDISLKRYRHAVKDDGELTRQRAVFSIDAESQDALKEWGVEKIDALCFTAIQASPTKIFYGGTATSTATLTATDKLTPTLISKAKTWANTGGNRAQTPLRPIKINGKNFYVLLVHPDVMFDLKQDSTFAQARREALDRGKDNPIFMGSEAIWDGVVIHEHENMDIATTWGAGADVTGAKCSLMGAQSLVWAWGKRPQVIAKDFDYGEKHGFAWGMTARTGKPVFNSKDYGSLAVYVARTQISDA